MVVTIGCKLKTGKHSLFTVQAVIIGVPYWSTLECTRRLYTVRKGRASFTACYWLCHLIYVPFWLLPSLSPPPPPSWERAPMGGSRGGGGDRYPEREERHRYSTRQIFIFIFYFLGGFFLFFLLYSALLHLPPLRFHCADGCWDRTKDRCNWCIGSQTL